MAVQAVHVDGDFHEGVRGTTGGVTNRDAAVVLLFSNLGSLLDGLTSATAGWGWDDVVFVVRVASQSVGVDGDLHEGVRLAARGMAYGDALFGFNLLGGDFRIFRCILDRPSVATARRCRDDVVAVVTVAVQTVEIDGDFHVRIGRALRGVTDRDLLPLGHRCRWGDGGRRRTRSPTTNCCRGCERRGCR